MRRWPLTLLLEGLGIVGVIAVVVLVHRQAERVREERVMCQGVEAVCGPGGDAGVCFRRPAPAGCWISVPP